MSESLVDRAGVIPFRVEPGTQPAEVTNRRGVRKEFVVVSAGIMPFRVEPGTEPAPVLKRLGVRIGGNCPIAIGFFGDFNF